MIGLLGRDWITLCNLMNQLTDNMHTVGKKKLYVHLSSISKVPNRIVKRTGLVVVCEHRQTDFWLLFHATEAKNLSVSQAIGCLYLSDSSEKYEKIYFLLQH